MIGAENFHYLDSSFTDIFRVEDLLSLLVTGFFEIDGKLFDDHVKLLFGLGFVWVGPPVGEGELEHIVGVDEFEFDPAFEFVLELVDDIGRKYVGSSSAYDAVFSVVPEYFFIDEGEDIEADVCSHAVKI